MTYTLPFLHKYRFFIAILLTVFVSSSIVAFKMAPQASTASESARVANYIIPAIYNPSHETSPTVDGSLRDSAPAEAITAAGKLTFERPKVTTTPAPKKEEPAAKKPEDAKPAAPSPANVADAASAPAAAAESAPIPAVAQAQPQAKAPASPAAPANNNSAPAPVSAPMEGTSPAAAQSFARSYLAGKGMGEAEFQCLVTLWNRESGWNFQASNSSSGAYGIPQSLPGSKMASAGADWQTNPKTQIIWGVGYITGRYGTPCGAVASWNVKGWY